MHWFTNLSTRTKLLLAFAPLIAFLLIVIATALTALAVMRDAELTVTDMMKFRSNLNGQQAALSAAILSEAGGSRNARLDEVADYTQDNDATISRLVARNHADPGLAALVQQIATLREEMRRTGEEEIIPFLRQDKPAEATALLLGIQAERYAKLRELARNFSKHITAQAEMRHRHAKTICLLLAVVGVVLAIVIAVALNRLIARPLAQITEIADRIARGDLNAEFSANGRGDEIGGLNQTFQRMSRTLKVVAGRARQIAAGDLTVQFKAQSEEDVLGTALVDMSENLRNIIGELVSAASVLGSSSSQIMASTAQLAAGAQETAAAVSETTTTVEEVKQTSRVSSEKAKYVSDRAQTASEISQTGKRSVDETIEGMNRIRQQMESIAESILSLSAQGQAIGEIIATVDDLASQSKLLAVNASIQAAQAGDEGKGFAVVAQEVRTLAEQSRQATSQVRGILGEIQKATSRAVLATEQGTKAVDSGVRQSGAAGNSITELTDSIAEAAQSAAQIAATSQQQFVGMDQIAMAMDNIKSASTQTVASTRQTEAAAQQLNEVGQRLKQLVERFKV